MLNTLHNRIRIALLRKEAIIHSKVFDSLNNDSFEKEDYNSIFTDKNDYIIVKNFITHVEITEFNKKRNAILNSNTWLKEKTKTGLFLGKSLLAANTLEEYFAVAEKYNRHENEILGFSFNKRLEDYIKKISDVKSVEIPKNKAGSDYLGNSIRVLSPGKAAFPVHTDKYVHDISEKSQELNTIISDENIVSFFAVLSNAEKGGQLYLFDYYYRNTPHSILNELTNGNFAKVQKFVYKRKSIKVYLEEGDLILFDAGQRWHLVEPIYGKKERVTIGCFSSYNKSKDKIFYWS
jgi:hypothetical protein